MKGEPMTAPMTQTKQAMLELAPCPFCGGEADYEEIPMGVSGHSTWSVGCASEDADCIGYQMIAHFSRKCEAAEAWNKRPASPVLGAGAREALADMIEVYDSIASTLADNGVGWNCFRSAHLESMVTKVKNARNALADTVTDTAQGQPEISKGVRPHAQGKPNTDQADYKIGWWLSAALEDPAVCAEMKADINAWFEAHQPGLVMASPHAEVREASTDAETCLCGVPGCSKYPPFDRGGK